MTTPHGPAGSAPTSQGPRPQLDVMAVLAAMQQQLDDLTEVVEAQQRTLQQILAALAPTAAEPAARSRPGGR